MKTLLSLIFLITAMQSSAESLKDKIYGSVTVDEVTSIYDADTFRVNIDQWPPLIGHRMSIQLDGVDAPEIKGNCPKEKEQAKKAKQLTVAFLRSAKTIELRNMKRGKYFRIIAEVYGDNKSLAGYLIKSGLVREYHGGTRKGWCD